MLCTHQRFIRSFLLIGIFLLSSFAMAQPTDPFDVPTPTAVENKLYEPSSEVNLQLGILPLDAFYKAVTFSASYAKYFQSPWGWEYLNVMAAVNSQTDLRKQLRDNFQAQEAELLDYVRYTVTSNLIYTPIYNKNLLFNSKVVHGEISMLAGGGVVSFDSSETTGMVGGGLIFRFFSSEKLSYKLDTRTYYHFADGKSTDFILSINLGVAFELDPDGKKNSRLGK